ncbi:MAG: MBL fold metallo-hydrolase [Acidobacteria bacterium]|jgi:glyoxylase-like metal-dependent hydrolase (beta-lactamase superfamily II)|nr:MBL fold metallo-hydrolase [Acidobacteriota bacterium]
MNIGDFRLEIISDTEIRLDGGAMFGVVPRVMWEKVCPPDSLNRVPLAAHCLYVEAGGEKILFETGTGEKLSEKLLQIYGMKREKSFAESLYETTGVSADEISIVVNTHLHFDHCGGNTKFNAAGDIIPAFPNARYFIPENELKHAENPTDRDRATYNKDNWEILRETGQMETKPPIYEVVKGITMTEMRGHNAAMQTVRIESGGEILYSFSDLIPMTAHLPLPWIMSYDLYPLETLANKKKLLPLAVQEKWLCWFYHDVEMPLCRLTEVDGKLKAIKYVQN